MNAKAQDIAYQSPTLQELRNSGALKNLDPLNPSTVCEFCKNAMWFLEEVQGLRCYCKVMHVIVFSKDELNQLVSCDDQR